MEIITSTKFVVDAEPFIVLEAATANAASPAVVFGIMLFDGPKLVAKAVLPVSLPNANTRLSGRRLEKEYLARTERALEGGQTEGNIAFGQMLSD